jgi:hypothetical protein
VSATVPTPGTAKAWFFAGDSAGGKLAAAGQGRLLTGTSLTVAAQSIALALER